MKGDVEFLDAPNNARRVTECGNIVGVDFGIELRKARQTAGLSIRALAERSGTSPSAISTIESGQRDPSVTTYERILNATGTTLQTGPMGQMVRSHTTAELPDAFNQSDRDMRILTQFVIDWNRRTGDDAFLLPGPTGTSDATTITAALVHALCDKDQIVPPDWVHDHHSDTPLSISGSNLNSRYGRNIIANTPPGAAEHNVYFHSELLDR